MIENLMVMLMECDVFCYMEGCFLCVVVIEYVLGSDVGKWVYDLVLDGLCFLVCYDQKYYDKIVVLLLLLLEKLIFGKMVQFIFLNYSDLNDLCLIFDWQQVICKKGVVYVGLDVFFDFEVVVVVGNSMFVDLVLVVGYIYKFGINDGLLQQSGGNILISFYCDEFSELMGDEFIFLINKGGGVGIQIMVYI